MDQTSIGNFVDMESALARVMGNKNLYKKLLGSYTKNTYLNQLREEIHRGDTEAAARTAHTIKGMCANLSLTQVHALSVTIEEKLKAGEDVADCLAQLEQAVENTLQAIDLLVNTL